MDMSSLLGAAAKPHPVKRCWVVAQDDVNKVLLFAVAPIMVVVQLVNGHQSIQCASILDCAVHRNTSGCDGVLGKLVLPIRLGVHKYLAHRFGAVNTPDWSEVSAVVVIVASILIYYAQSFWIRYSPYAELVGDYANYLDAHPGDSQPAGELERQIRVLADRSSGSPSIRAVYTAQCVVGLVIGSAAFALSVVYSHFTVSEFDLEMGEFQLNSKVTVHCVRAHSVSRKSVHILTCILFATYTLLKLYELLIVLNVLYRSRTRSCLFCACVVSRARCRCRKRNDSAEQRDIEFLKKMVGNRLRFKVSGDGDATLDLPDSGAKKTAHGLGDDVYEGRWMDPFITLSRYPIEDIKVSTDIAAEDSDDDINAY